MGAQEAVGRFELEPGDDEHIRSQLRNLLKKYHPDATGGEFKSDEQRKNYEDVLSTLAEGEGQSGAHLPVVQSREIVELVKRQNEIIANQVEESNRQIVSQRSAEKLNNMERSAVSAIRTGSAQRYLPFKISGGAMAAVGVFLSTSASSFNVIFGMSAAESATLNATLILFGAFTALAAFVQEERTKTNKQRMLSEPTFQRFLRDDSFAEILQITPGGVLFSSVDLTDSVKAFSSPKVPGLAGALIRGFEYSIFSSGLDELEAAQVADLMIERLVARALISPLSASLAPTFVLDDSFAEEIGRPFDPFGDGSLQVRRR